MAGACGIHIDQRRFRLIAVEGNARKQRIIACASGEVHPGEDPVEVVSSALRQVVKKYKIATENVGLAVDSGLAAFRKLTLPFDDRSKIEEVIKFEVENDLPQWDIDDVVVDFVVTSSKPGVESNLLVTAVPKMRLAMQVAACESAGLEPLDAELDGTALFNAAYASGVLDEETSQVLVHVGDATTTVVVVDGGRIASIRAIRAGARPALSRAAEPEEDADGEPSAESAEDEEERLRRLEDSSRRIRRELGRTISGARTENPIEAVYLCGDALPGLAEETLFDVPAVRLEAVPEGAAIADPQELVIAYGAAMTRLGLGGVQGHLRREDLKHTGKFERLELPLAVFSLLLFTLLAVKLIVTNKQINERDDGTMQPPWHQPLQNLLGNEFVPYAGGMQLWLEASNAYMFPDPTRPWPGRLTIPPKNIEDYARLAERGGDNGRRTNYEQILQIRRMLSLEVGRLSKELGLEVKGGQSESGTGEIPPPQSALQGATLVLGTLDGLGESVGRFALRRLTADYQRARSTDGDHIVVKIDVDFFAEDALQATQHFQKFADAIQGQPWCRRFEAKNSKNLTEGTGIFHDGITIEVDCSKVEETRS